MNVMNAGKDSTTGEALKECQHKWVKWGATLNIKSGPIKIRFCEICGKQEIKNMRVDK